MKKDTNLKLAVVGCGHWGPNHIRNFRAMSGVSVTWAVDRDPQRREHVSSLYDHLATTDNIDEMLADKSVTARRSSHTYRHALRRLHESNRSRQARPL